MKPPVRYSKEIAEEICLTIATHTDGVEKLCKSRPHWPEADTVFLWTIKNKEFGESYTQAKRRQVERLVDEILSVTKDPEKDFYDDGTGKKYLNHAYLQRMKIYVDSIKWIACKLVPRLYGDNNTKDTGEDSSHEKTLKDLGQEQ